MRWFLLKLALVALGLLPALGLGYGAFRDQLGPNPVETLLHDTGLWALRGLLLTLTLTPLRKLTRWHGIVRLRRTLGLLTFFYAALHFCIYLTLDRQLDWLEISVDLGKRPYIIVGFTAFLLLLALAATSFDRAIKWLGGLRWQQLHSLVYPAAALAVLHFAWLVKADRREALLYTLLLLLLLLPRLWWQRQARLRAQTGRAAARGCAHHAGSSRHNFPIAVQLERPNPRAKP